MKKIGIAGFILAILFLIFIFSCYLFQPDCMMAITFFPVWMWIPFGIIFCVSSLFWNARCTLIISSCWIVFALVMVEELPCLVRGILNSNNYKELEPDFIRIISINCAGANYKAAKEAIVYKPDILLLQESPLAAEVNDLAKGLFGDSGHFTWNRDTSIIANGTVRGKNLEKTKASFFSIAHVVLKNGFECEIVNARLLPTFVGLNLLSADNWKCHKQNRIDHRQQIRKIIEEINQIPENTPIIVGGDLNVVTGDGSVQMLRPRLKDSAIKGGIGWPNTAPNEIPLVRIDQIWTSPHIQIVRVRAQRTSNSDHRMLICEFLQ